MGNTSANSAWCIRDEASFIKNTLLTHVQDLSLGKGALVSIRIERIEYISYPQPEMLKPTSFSVGSSKYRGLGSQAFGRRLTMKLTAQTTPPTTPSGARGGLSSKIL